MFKSVSLSTLYNKGDKCLRIPDVKSVPLEGVNLEGAENNTAPAILLSNHMVR
jgi:hypothetical protein